MSPDRSGPAGTHQKRAHLDPVGTAAVLVSCAFWGGSGIFVKLIGRSSDVSALALAFWRDMVTFLVLGTGVALLRPAWLRVRRQDLRWLAALGVSVGAFHVVWNLGVFLNGAAVATVQQAAMPAIVAVAARFIWKEPLTPTKVAAIVLIFAGTVLVSGIDVLGISRLTPAGFVVGLSIPIGYAAWNLFLKKVRSSHNPFTSLLFAFGFAALVLLPLQAFTPQPFPVPPVALLWFSALILITTIAGFVVYTFGLGRLPASVATILAMTEILFSVAYAYVFLGERLTASQIVGALLVVAGVLVLSLPNGRRSGSLLPPTSP